MQQLQAAAKLLLLMLLVLSIAERTKNARDDMVMTGIKRSTILQNMQADTKTVRLHKTVPADKQKVYFRDRSEVRTHECMHNGYLHDWKLNPP
jgi:hypothetical protein